MLPYAAVAAKFMLTPFTRAGPPMAAETLLAGKIQSAKAINQMWREMRDNGYTWVSDFELWHGP